jgi:putative transposase
MGTFRLERGLVVRIGDRLFAFHRQIDDKKIQLEDVMTGELRSMHIGDFLNRVNQGQYVVAHQTADGMIAALSSSRDKARRVVLGLKLTETQSAQWRLRSLYVQGMYKRGVTRGQRSRIARAIVAIAQAQDDSKPPSASTVMGWMRTFEQKGRERSALISQNAVRAGSARLSSAWLEHIQQMLNRHYFIRNGESIAAVAQRLSVQVSKGKLPKGLDANFLVVNESTVRRIAAQTDPYHRDRARYGPAYASAKWRHAIGGIYATRPMQRVEMDHTVLDIYVIDEVRGIPLGRPTLTIMADGYSGYILAAYISFEGCSVGRVAHTIKLALSPKEEVAQRYSLEQSWHTPGLWETLVLDNGLEFHSQHMRTISMELCFDIEYCPVRRPWFKPVVERHMLEMARILPIPGRVQKLFGISDPMNPKQQACVTFPDLCACLTKWVVDVHPVTINHRRLARPLDLLMDGLKDMPSPTYVDNLQSLDIIGGIAKRLTVRHTGIEMQYLTYRSRELADIAKQVAPSFPVNVKINPDDLGSIWVEHPKDKSWINVPATAQVYAKSLTLFQHKMIRQHAKEHLGRAGAPEILLRAQEQLRDMWDVAVRSGKKIKGDAKKLALLEGVRSSSLLGRHTSDESHGADQVVTTEELRIPADAVVPDFETFSAMPNLR